MNHEEDKTQTIEIVAIGSDVGCYRILQRIGAGGMGTVFLAEDTESGNRVAMKVVDQRFIKSGLVKKEIEALSVLEHDHVLGLIEALELQNQVCIVTEYIEGPTLYDLIKTESLTFDSIRRYADQMLEALDYIHARGFIHSDLKPHNMIIDRNDNIKVIDFGIVLTASAKIAADIKHIRGTLHYMSPEQVDRRPCDIRSDLFSFGVILYEMCTGNKPFRGQKDNAIMYSILFDDPIPAEKISNRVSVQVSALIMKLLSKNPADRPGSALEVRRLLREACEADREPIGSQSNRLAILPFTYPEDDEKSRVLAQGLGEEFYSRFLGVEDLEVVSPLKMEPHLNELVDGHAIRMLLGADIYLRGRVYRVADRVRIYFTLYFSDTEKVIWSDKFDSPMGNLFELIDAIADTVLIELKVRLTSRNSAVAGAKTSNPDAYELYLLARSYYVKNTQKDIEYAREILHQGLQMDPDYSLACVGLADCHCAEYMNYFNRSEDTIRQAVTWAERALKMAPRLPEAYRSMGRIMQTTGQPDKARDYYLKAVTYNGDYYQAYRSLGWLAVDAYRYDEAMSWVRKALSIKSTDIEAILLRGLIHFDRKDSISAINDFTRCLELRPDYGRAYFQLGMAYFQLGRIKDAISHMQKAIDLGGDINAPFLSGIYYLAAGEHAQAAEAFEVAAYSPEMAFMAKFHLGFLAELSGDKKLAESRYRESYQNCIELLEMDGNLLPARLTMCKTMGVLGEKEKCRPVLEELRRLATFDGAIAQELAYIYAILGDKEEASRYIEMAVEAVRGPSREEVNNDPLIKYFLQ